MDVGLYIRVSTEEQVEGYSIDAQRRAIEGYCASLGWTVVDVFIDEGYSGTNDKRPAFQRLREVVRLRKIKRVVVHKLDRLARNAQLTFNIIAEWQASGVGFVSVAEQMDFESPIGRVMLGTLASFAEFFSLNLATEVRKGLREKAQQGGWVGPRPIGYDLTSNGLQPNGDADIVRAVFLQYAGGNESYNSLADAMNKRTGQHRFGREAIRTILRNPAYKGVVTMNGVQYPGNHQPLVDADTWQRCADIRKQREGKKGKVSVKGPKQGGLLTELCYCAKCGQRMWYHYSGRKGNVAYYTCKGRSARTCDAKLVRGDVVENAIISLVKSLTIPEGLRTDVLSLSAALVNSEGHSEKIDKAGIERGIQRLVQTYVDGLINEADYKRQRDYLQGQLALASEQEVDEYEFDAAMAMELLNNMAELIDEATPAELRVIVRCLFHQIWVESHAITAITPTQEFLPLVGVINVVGVAEGFQRPQTRYRPPIWTTFKRPYSVA